jgi:hypothetical protein
MNLWSAALFRRFLSSSLIVGRCVKANKRLRSRRIEKNEESETTKRNA